MDMLRTRATAWRVLVSVAVLVAAAGVAVALFRNNADGGARPTAPALASPAASPMGRVIEVVWGDETVKLLRNGSSEPLPPAVPVSGALLARFSVSKGELPYLRYLEVELFRLTAPDEGVAGADISAWSLMILMGHGGVAQDAIDLGNGHYRIPLQFTMPGAWQVDITINTDQESGVISLEIPAWE